MFSDAGLGRGAGSYEFVVLLVEVKPEDGGVRTGVGSGAGAEVDRVREALALARARAPGVAFDGEFQADTALNATIAEKKGATGPAAGQANVLIFPSLSSGNIGYKLVQELAGAQALGPFLQGFARPVCDLSRGASVDDVVAATAITLAMAKRE